MGIVGLASIDRWSHQAVLAGCPSHAYTHNQLNNHTQQPRSQEYLTVPERFEGRDQKRVREVLYLMYVQCW